MSFSKLFDVKTQLKFYGAYHANPINVAVHVICVPIILWTAQVMLSWLPMPSFIPAVHYQISNHLRFDLNLAAIHTAMYLLYYFTLEPAAALLYAPQLVLSLLTAIAYSHGGQTHVNNTILLHIFSWIAQFMGHGLAEKRAPALLDNLLGAVVLAPFFVHMEILFMLGYRPTMHRELNIEIGKEIARISKINGDKKRQAAKSS